METKFKCPVCGELTLDEERMFDICPICGWEDDNVQFKDPDFWGGANYFSLNKYRELYKKGVNIKEAEEKDQAVRCEKEVLE